MAAGTFPFPFVPPAGLILMVVSTSLHQRNVSIVSQVRLCMGGVLLLASVGWLQGELDRRQDRTVV